MSKRRRRRSRPGAARKRRLEAAVQAIQQRWGQEALHKGKQATADPSIPSLPTGLSRLDHILSIGGLPLGHISELIGQPTSGKRTLALHILAYTQRHYPCLYIDLAQTFDPAYATACRVNLAQLAIAAPGDPGQALNLASDLAAGGHFGLIIFDSTTDLLATALPPGSATTALRRLRQGLAGKRSALLFLTTPLFEDGTAAPNSPSAAGYPTGFNLHQQAALRLAVNRHRWLHRRGVLRGYEAQVMVLRNRWGRPGQQAIVQITFNGVHVHGN